MLVRVGSVVNHFLVCLVSGVTVSLNPDLGVRPRLTRIYWNLYRELNTPGVEVCTLPCYGYSLYLTQIFMEMKIIKVNEVLSLDFKTTITYD